MSQDHHGCDGTPPTDGSSKLKIWIKPAAEKADVRAITEAAPTFANRNDATFGCAS